MDFRSFDSLYDPSTVFLCPLLKVISFFITDVKYLCVV